MYLYKGQYFETMEQLIDFIMGEQLISYSTYNIVCYDVLTIKHKREILCVIKYWKLISTKQWKK